MTAGRSTTASTAAIAAITRRQHHHHHRPLNTKKKQEKTGNTTKYNTINIGIINASNHINATTITIDTTTTTTTQTTNTTTNATNGQEGARRGVWRCCAWRGTRSVGTVPRAGVVAGVRTPFEFLSGQSTANSALQELRRSGPGRVGVRKLLIPVVVMEVGCCIFLEGEQMRRC